MSIFKIQHTNLNIIYFHNAYQNKSSKYINHVSCLEVIIYKIIWHSIIESYLIRNKIIISEHIPYLTPVVGLCFPLSFSNSKYVHRKCHTKNHFIFKLCAQRNRNVGINTIAELEISN